jgi:hypothetical protein
LSRQGRLNIPAMVKELDLPGGEAQIIGGQYVVKVGAYGECVGRPLEVDIEVRLNKAPYTVTKRYAVQVPWGSMDYQNLHPYGQIVPDWYSFCPHESRNNPHANWWQGALLVDVRGGGVQKKEFYVPAHGFEPGRASEAWECGGQTGNDMCFVAMHSVNDAVPNMAAQIAARCAYYLRQNKPYGNYGDYPLSQDTLNTLGVVYEAALGVVTAPGLYRYERMGGLGGTPVFTRYGDWTGGEYFGWAQDVNAHVLPLLQTEIDAGYAVAFFHVMGWASSIYLASEAELGGCPSI